jgi:hypothetical protein
MEERRPTHEKPQLVRVFDTQDDAEAQVVRGLLESAGIEALLTGRDAPQDVLPGVGGVMVQVAAARRWPKPASILPSRKPDLHLLAIEIKSHRAGDVGAPGANLPGAQAGEHVWPWMAEGIARAG